MRIAIIRSLLLVAACLTFSLGPLLYYDILKLSDTSWTYHWMFISLWLFTICGFIIGAIAIDPP